MSASAQDRRLGKLLIHCAFCLVLQIRCLVQRVQRPTRSRDFPCQAPSSQSRFQRDLRYRQGPSQVCHRRQPGRPARERPGRDEPSARSAPGGRRRGDGRVGVEELVALESPRRGVRQCDPRHSRRQGRRRNEEPRFVTSGSTIRACRADTCLHFVAKASTFRIARKPPRRLSALSRRLLLSLSLPPPRLSRRPLRMVLAEVLPAHRIRASVKVGRPISPPLVPAEDRPSVPVIRTTTSTSKARDSNSIPGHNTVPTVTAARSDQEPHHPPMATPDPRASKIRAKMLSRLPAPRASFISGTRSRGKTSAPMLSRLWAPRPVLRPLARRPPRPL